MKQNNSIEREVDIRKIATKVMADEYELEVLAGRMGEDYLIADLIVVAVSNPEVFPTLFNHTLARLAEKRADELIEANEEIGDLEFSNKRLDSLKAQARLNKFINS